MSRKKKKTASQKPPGESPPDRGELAVEGTPAHPLTRGQVALVAGLLAIAGLWSYWPNLVEMVHVWNSNADYSHGYLVVPLALYFLWVRQDQMPWQRLQPAAAGLVLIAAALVFRYYADKFYLYELATWSLVPFVAGCCWLIGGRRFFWWTLPAVAFLLFAMKMPARLERGLSTPLRELATDMSCWILQFFGQPAFPDGNTIFFGERQLHVVDACAGLRMSLGILALTYAFILLTDRPAWQKVALALSAVPVAILANSLRIVVTGVLLQQVSGEVAETFLHDLSGFVMIPVAAGMLFGVLWLLDQMTVEVTVEAPGRVGLA